MVARREQGAVGNVSRGEWGNSKEKRYHKLNVTLTPAPQKHHLVQPTNTKTSQDLKARRHTRRTNQAIPYDLATSVVLATNAEEKLTTH